MIKAQHLPFKVKIKKMLKIKAIFYKLVTIYGMEMGFSLNGLKRSEHIPLGHHPTNHNHFLDTRLHFMSVRPNMKKKLNIFVGKLAKCKKILYPLIKNTGEINYMR